MASEDPVSEEEGVNASTNAEATLKCSDEEVTETAAEKKEEKIVTKDKSSNKVESKSSSKKSKNSYSIAALCQVNLNVGT